MAGRPKNPDKLLPVGVYAKQSDIDYLLTWNTGNTTAAFSELVEELRKVRPTGRYSAPRPSADSKNKPGTRTWLKRRIKALESQLKQAGIAPAEVEQ